MKAFFQAEIQSAKSRTAEIITPLGTERRQCICPMAPLHANNRIQALQNKSTTFCMRSGEILISPLQTP